MESRVNHEASRFLREIKNHRRWLAVFCCLALIVAAGTVMALKYTGSAMTHTQQVLNCKLQVHQHTGSCYGANGELVCGQADYVVHTHNDDCYDAVGNLVCQLPEKTAHKHSESCWTDVQTLICTIPEAEAHAHSEACYAPVQGELICTDESEEHQHTDECYAWTQELVCGLEETEGHTHSEACYTTEHRLACKELELHVHTAACYAPDANGNPIKPNADGKYEGTLICGIPQLENHVHGSECLETVEMSNDEIESMAAAKASQEAAEAAAAESEAAEEGGKNFFTTEDPDTVATVEAEPVETSEAPEGDEAAEEATEAPEGEIAGNEAAAEQEPVSEDPEMTAAVYPYSAAAQTENYQIVVSYNDDAKLPEGVTLRAYEITAESDPERWAEKTAEYQAQMNDDTASLTFLLDIGFYLDGVEVEPEAAVQVSILPLAADAEAGEVNIIHFAEEGTEILDSISGTENQIQFQATSFSLYGGGDNGEATVLADGGDGSGTMQVPTHSKYIKDNGDFTYDLTLDVKGSVGSTTEKAMLDIVIVFDKSGSMGDTVSGNTTRLKKARDAVSNLVSTINAKNNEIDVRWSLVTFASSANTATAWENSSTFATRVSAISGANGGTNYEAALKKAGTKIADARAGAEKVVIFLTDGVPTFHDTNSQGGGNKTNKADYEGALEGAETITCDRFYAVGVDLSDDTQSWGSGSSKVTKTPLGILQDVATATSATKKKAENVSSSDISSYLNDIAGSITTYEFSNVTITDNLSDNVQPVEGAVPVIKVLNASGQEVSPSDSDYPQGISASYVEAGKQIVLDFPDSYKLKDGWTYQVTLTIQPSQTACDYYKTNQAYPDRGDEGTDAVGNTSSSGKAGFYSNTSANVAFTYNGSASTSPYKMPVVQVDVFNLQPDPIVENTDSERTKTIFYNSDADTYDLSLTFKGPTSSSTTSTTVTPKVNVVFVLDTSNSMKWPIDYAGDSQSYFISDGKYQTNATLNINGTQYQASRFYYQNEAVKTAANSLVNRSDIDAMYTVVSFNSKAGVKTAWTSSLLTSNPTTSVADNGGNGGTNYEAGLTLAKNQLISLKNSNSSRKDAVDVIVFMSDGEPTMSNSGGDGTSYKQAYLTAGGNVIKGISYNPGLGTEDEDRLELMYAVGVGPESKYTKLNNLLDNTYVDRTYTNVKTDASYFFVGNTPSNLENAFNSITSTIISTTKTTYATNVTITDVLSEYVEIVEGTDVWISVTDAEGNEMGVCTAGKLGVSQAAYVMGTGDDAVTLTAYYRTSGDQRQVILDFPDTYKLDQNLTYRVTFTVRATDAAYDQFAVNGYEVNGQPIFGDANTDAEGNATSAGKYGLYSNNYNATEVTYTFGDTTQAEKYPRPVIQVKASQLQVTKIGEEDQTLAGAAFTLYRKDSQGNYSTLVCVTGTTPANGVISIAKNYLTTGEYKLVETSMPNGYAAMDDIYFTVSRGVISNIHTLDENGTAAAASQVEIGTASAKDGVVTYPVSITDPVAKVTIRLEKGIEGEVVEEGEERTLLSGATFELKEGDTVIGTYTTGADGTVDIPELQMGHSYTLTETVAPNGYTLLANPVHFTIRRVAEEDAAGNISYLSVSGAGASEDFAVIGGDGILIRQILVLDSSGALLPHTGGMGTTVFTIAGIAVIAAGLFYGFLIKRKPRMN